MIYTGPQNHKEKRGLKVITYYDSILVISSFGGVLFDNRTIK